MNDGRSAQPSHLLLGHHALDILGLALDAVARAAVRLDRQAADDGIDAALLDVRAAPRPLLLVVDVVIDREMMGHGRGSLEDGLLGVTASESNKSRRSARTIPVAEAALRPTRHLACRRSGSRYSAAFSNAAGNPRMTAPLDPVI